MRYFGYPLSPLMFGCKRCVSIGIACLCLAQGAKAPSAATVGQIVSVPATANSTVTPAGAGISWVNMVDGRVYVGAERDGKLYVEVDKRPPPGRTLPPPLISKST